MSDPSVEIGSNTDEETLFADSQREKASLQRAFGEAHRAVSLWKRNAIEYDKELPVASVLKEKVANMTRLQVERNRNAWEDELKLFKDFLQMISQKQKELEKDKQHFDMSSPTYILSSTVSLNFFNMLLDSVPSVEKAITSIQKILAIYDARLQEFRNEEPHVVVWLKEAQDLAEKAKKTLQRVSLLLEEYSEISRKFNEIATNLQKNSAQVPYFSQVDLKNVRSLMNQLKDEALC